MSAGKERVTQTYQWTAYLKFEGSTCLKNEKEILEEFTGFVKSLQAVGVRYKIVVMVENRAQRPLPTEYPMKEIDKKPAKNGQGCDNMAKFILSVGDGTFKILTSEAHKRDVTVQQLLRAVIVPEWVKENIEVNQHTISPREIAPHLMHQSIYPNGRDQLLQTAVNRLRST